MNMDLAFNRIIAAFQHKACLADMLALNQGQKILILVIIFLIVGFIVLEIDRRRRYRKAAGRRHMSTEEFLDSVGVESRWHGLCLAIREQMARQGRVPVEVIYPSDSMKFLCSLTFDGFDTVEIVMEIEDTLNISIPGDIAEKLPFPFDSTSLADCIRGFLECEALMSLIPPEESIQTEQETEA